MKENKLTKDEIKFIFESLEYYKYSFLHQMHFKPRLASDEDYEKDMESYNAGYNKCEELKKKLTKQLPIIKKPNPVQNKQYSKKFVLVF